MQQAIAGRCPMKVSRELQNPKGPYASLCCLRRLPSLATFLFRFCLVRFGFQLRICGAGAGGLSPMEPFPSMICLHACVRYDRRFPTGPTETTQRLACREFKNLLQELKSRACFVFVSWNEILVGLCVFFSFSLLGLGCHSEAFSSCLSLILVV
jgi:hypothetical protein